MFKYIHAILVFYLKLCYIDCMARGIHRVAKGLRDQFYNVDLLISITKVFLKALFRIRTYEKGCT